MFAIRKSDLKAFTPDSHSVCRIEDGSTNEYLQEPRVVEEFLKSVEPKYNEAVDRLTTSAFDSTSLYALSGFIAYITSCSPAGMRLHSNPLQRIVEETGRHLDAKGEFDTFPSALSGKTFTELIDRGDLEIRVDPKYPQAIGISQILSSASAFGNFCWEILLNEFSDSPFFTSDFPVAIEETSDPRIINRIVPLTPKIAVRLRPNLDAQDAPIDFRYALFRKRVVKASRKEVMAVNRQIVRCAEQVVFFSRNLPWIPTFVQKNSNYRLVTATERIPHGSGTLLWSRLTLKKIQEQKSV